MFVMYLVSVMLYLGIGAYLYRCLMVQQPIHKLLLLGVLMLAAGLHAALLYPQIITLYGLNFNLFNTLSLISLILLLYFVGFGLYRPILSLGVLAIPTAIIGISFGYFGKAPYQPISHMDIGLQIHILLSFVAYCALLMAAVQALILRLQIRELKHQTVQRFWVSRLPSLQSMESLLFDMILLGFVILSLAIALGITATYDVMAQHVMHKLVFSVLSWVVFGILIAGHYKKGWRGMRAANVTLYGFALLALGFVGSKTVLEIILK